MWASQVGPQAGSLLWNSYMPVIHHLNQKKRRYFAPEIFRIAKLERLLTIVLKPTCRVSKLPAPEAFSLCNFGSLARLARCRPQKSQRTGSYMSFGSSLGILCRGLVLVYSFCIAEPEGILFNFVNQGQHLGVFPSTSTFTLHAFGAMPVWPWHP